MSALQETQEPKHQKKQSKIIDKLNQLTERYPNRTEQNAQQKMALISNNQLRKHQLNRLIEECSKLTQIPLPMIVQICKNYDMLFVGTTKQLTNESIIDVRLKIHDEFEDYLYMKIPAVHASFRRGLCLMQKNNEYSIMRRGLKKFFDINLKNKLNEDILQITKMEKVNGENAQISYCSHLEKWVVGSKNVTLLCENEEDLQSYDVQNTKNELDNRYKFAIKIAQIWLKIIRNSTKIEEIKQLLMNHTLIGEYCGNNDHQHLVQYQDIQVKFYALVSHDEDDTCLHPIKALQQIEQLGLNVVKYINFEMKSQEEVQQKLQQITEQVFLSKLDEEGEGVVLYLSNENKCIQLVKLKTLEYRAKRKIREKLKLIINKNQDWETQLKKFTEEMKILIQQISEAIDKTLEVEHYENLAEKCFQQASKIRNDTEFRQFCNELIETKFILFLETIQKGESNVFENLYQM